MEHFATQIFFASLAKVFPYRAPAGLSGDLAALSQRYRWWQSVAAILDCAFAALCVFLWFQFFLLLQSVFQGRMPVSLFLMHPDGFLFLLPALFLGLVSAAIPAHFALACLLRGRYREYTHYQNLRVGFDAWKVLRWFGLATILLFLPVGVLGLFCHTRFTQESLVNHPFFSLSEHEHPYAAVEEIRLIASFKAPSGDIVVRPYYEIVFQDGFIWSTRDELHQMEMPEIAAIIDFVSKRSGKPVTAYRIAPN